MILFNLIKAQWRIILLAAVIALAYYYKTCYNASVAELATFKADIATLEVKTKAINDEKLRIAKITALDSETEYKNEIKRRDLNSAKLKKDLENERKNIIALLANANKLRNKAASDSKSVSDFSTTSEVFTIGGSNTTVTLITAGQSCAIDYKELMNAWLDACKVYGCE